MNQQWVYAVNKPARQPCNSTVVPFPHHDDIPLCQPPASHPQTANVLWKRNRNAYARLLVEQLRCGKLVEPFTKQPPGGPLPTLPKHLAYAFKPPRSSRAAASTAMAAATRRSPGATATASALQGAQAATQQALSQQALSQGVQQRSLLSASEQLDEYLGRADFRRAEAAEEEAAVASAFVPREALATSSVRTAGAGAGGSAAPHRLPGTRMQLRGAEGRRVDRWVQLLLCCVGTRNTCRGACTSLPPASRRINKQQQSLHPFQVPAPTLQAPAKRCRVAAQQAGA